MAENHFVETKGIQISYRPGTTDIKVLEEVIRKNVYEHQSLGLRIEPNDIWLDLGGNIGVFSLLCISKGAFPITYEPEPENIRMCQQNGIEVVPLAVSVTNGSVPLYVCNGEYNKYQHTLCKKRGRKTIMVETVSFDSLISDGTVTAVKMDIEGAEIAILESQDRWYNVEKLVFEYSFDVDPSIRRFLDIIERLRQSFATVHYTKVKSDQEFYRHFPRSTIVYCVGRI